MTDYKVGKWSVCFLVMVSGNEETDMQMRTYPSFSIIMSFPITMMTMMMMMTTLLSTNTKKAYVCTFLS